MPQAPAHDSTLRSSASARPKSQVFRYSHPPWSEADQIAAYIESEETEADTGPTSGTLSLEEPEQEADLSQIGVNGERIDLRRCSWCDELTHRLKAFNLPKFLIIPLHHFHLHDFETERNEACPGCMRRILLKYLTCQIITANILWPVIVLPIYVFYFALTFRKGHSS
jgi:hypothetical protein